MDRHILVVDVESTCWEPPSSKPSNEMSEIIEIGVALVNVDTNSIVDNDCIIVKPQKSKVSEFCTKLTTLTQERVDKGVKFHEACRILENKYKSSERVFVSWGDYDRKMFERNCKTLQARYPFGPRHMNLKNTFALFNRLEKEIDLGEALNFFDMKLEGTHHRGIDDARNIANIFIKMSNLYWTGYGV